MGQSFYKVMQKKNCCPHAGPHEKQHFYVAV